MRMLRKIGTVEPVFGYTALLAARADMETFVQDDVQEKAKPKAKPEADNETDETETGNETETGEQVEQAMSENKTKLKAELRSLDVFVKGNPSVKTLQAKLTAARAEAGESD